MSDDTPIVAARENGPLIVKHLKTFKMPDGSVAEAKPLIALCRCGHSKNKPYCDGSHNDAGFDGSAQDVSARDKVYSYDGNAATVHYNKLLCSHAGECGKHAGNIFNPKNKPWCAPDAGTLEQIKTVVAACPSGALSYSTADSARDALCSDEVEISVETNGPFRVKNVPIEVDYWADGQSAREYVLCRCGLSKNKLFCDGTHVDEGWSDS